jgi:hypothetical protein
LKLERPGNLVVWLLEQKLINHASYIESFSQKDFTCDHWYNVDCKQAPNYYSLNSDPDVNPYTKDDKKKALEAAALDEYKSYHAPKYSGDYY